MDDVPPSDAGRVRASDAEREAVAAELRQHLEDGRLTMEEFLERLDEVYAARTRAQLDHARRELPHLAPPPTAAPAPGRRGSRPARSLAKLGSLPLVLAAVWLGSGHHSAFVPGWVILAGAAVALRRLHRGPGLGGPARREAQAAREGTRSWPPPDARVPPEPF